MENNNNMSCLLCLDTFHENADYENVKDLRKTLFALINYLSTSRSKDNIIPDQVQSVILSSACKVCIECQTLLETFTSFLKQLEIAKLKVDSCVRQIRDVLLEGNKFEGEEIKYSKLKSFRRCLLGKANLEVKTTEPTVRLHRNQFSTSRLLPTSQATGIVPVKPKLEIKEEPKQNDADNVSMEIDLEMPFSNVKSECTDVNLKISGKSDWECCNCDNPPEGDPPVLYYNVKCLQAQSSAGENTIPHFLCKSCKDGAEKSSESVFHRKCPKCGEIGAWLPEDLRPILLSKTLVRWIKPEQHFKYERSKRKVSLHSKAGKAQRQLVHELLLKLEKDPLKEEDKQEQEMLEKELSEYFDRKRSSGHGHGDGENIVGGNGLEEAFKFVNKQEQEWLAQVKWALLQKLKSLKAERMEWKQTRKFFGKNQCGYCFKCFNTKDERRYHFKTAHRTLVTFFCTVSGCRYSTTSKFNMKRHMTSTNCPQKDFVVVPKCKFCKRQQCGPKRLKEHEGRCKENPMYFAYLKKRRLERKMKAAADQTEHNEK